MTILTVSACNGSRSDYVSVPASITALTHVRVIDGTGAPGQDDQTILIHDDRIEAVGDSATLQLPPNARIIELQGRTIFPGLVGMHEHLFYEYQEAGSEAVSVLAQEPFSKLYLASGVTTIRTAGTFDLAGDLRLKRSIDGGHEAGPRIHVTGSYLSAATHDPDPEGIARKVEAEANQGATSFKAYTTLRASELRAAIQAAHARGLRITGHLCAVGFREAAAMGIDNVEHGLPFDADVYSGKQPDRCPDQGAVFRELMGMDASDPAIVEALDTLITHGVALTSTLAVLESFTARGPAFDPRLLDVLSPELRDRIRAAHEAWTGSSSVPVWTAALRHEMAFERAFAAAGGKLMAGVDPTGWGGVVAGFGDQRELELLVEAGLSPEQAIEVATLSGAAFLNEADVIGTVRVGKVADLVVVRGNPSARISDVRNVEIVFKDGVGYDPTKLIASAQGTVGQLDRAWQLRLPLVIFLVVLTILLLASLAQRPARTSSTRNTARKTPMQ